MCPPVDADIRDLPSILLHSPISVLDWKLAWHFREGLWANGGMTQVHGYVLLPPSGADKD